MEMRIAITDLAKYNAGELHYEWVDLPSADIWEDVKRICGDNEWFISDYELPIKISEYPNLDDLNNFAGTIDNSKKDDDILEAIIQHADDMGYDLDSIIRIIIDNDYMVYTDINSARDLGERYADETGMFGSLPEWVQRYIDYEKFGDELLEDDWDLNKDLNIAVCLTR